MPRVGVAMGAIGEEVCERGHIAPARMAVNRYVRTKYACAAGHAVKTAPAPGGVVDGGKYEPSVYAHVVVGKYGDHLPLNRLQGIFKRHGVRLPRQSMWDLLVRTDELDDTGSHAAVLVLGPIQRLFWLERAIKVRAARRNMSLAEIIELRQGVRNRHSARLIDKIHAVAGALELQRSSLPKSALGKALTYLGNQKGPLDRSVADPRLPIHNNDSERDLRHIAVGRKNWMVFASERGGAMASRLYSLVLSCKEADINPEAYIEDVLQRIWTTRAADIAELTPWAWAAARRTDG